MYTLLDAGWVQRRGSKQALKRPRALPSQTERPVFDRNCNRGPPHSWKLLHKLVNLEDPSLHPPHHTLMMKRAEGKHDAHRHFFMRPTHTCKGDTRAIGEPVPLFADTGAATVWLGQGPAHWWTTAQELICWITCQTFYLTRGALAVDDLLSSTLNYWLQMCLYFCSAGTSDAAGGTVSTEQFKYRSLEMMCSKVKHFPHFLNSLDSPESGHPYSSRCRDYFL